MTDKEKKADEHQSSANKEDKNTQPEPKEATNSEPSKASSSKEDKKVEEVKDKAPKTSEDTKQSDEKNLDAMPLPRRIAYLQQVITYTQEWIQLADTKGGLLLTTSGVIAGFMLNQLSKFSSNWSTANTWHLIAVAALFLLYIGYQLHSFMHTMWCIIPRPMGMSRDILDKTRHVFNYSLTLNFPKLEDNQALIDEYSELTEEDIFKEYVAQLHIDSVVCTQKYASFMVAFRSFKFALMFGALAFVTSFPSVQTASNTLTKKVKARIVKKANQTNTRQTPPTSRQP
ncbi:MAG TPA: hypothetical protein DCE42_26230 [Myxococcales bacterium]|nr:hypothetical protein [Deltaproteobacteria bacterium]HAA58288.1 hypothetical protein [Myxococcales bacterium]|tara:strand:- start:809 stop:1666 length:858 start_codon:yes stop_codon:yes gene_type:complete